MQGMVHKFRARILDPYKPKQRWSRQSDKDESREGKSIHPVSGPKASARRAHRRHVWLIRLEGDQSSVTEIQKTMARRSVARRARASQRAQGHRVWFGHPAHPSIRTRKQSAGAWTSDEKSIWTVPQTLASYLHVVLPSRKKKEK
jgi:hypothetical protein